ncbi:eukaryotic translation initiation factor 3 subunit 7-domain-containing protein [Lasiosphaeris hirsuta]|uniref:Eukaryotic translation initiation factor 3 subunit D n=1 Tax=Lasiosphaeris hirsuta TaxID=260670 RepID=A0AA40E8H9_9PEZI|nr:eukaryotic translation initiation factor 3 subunit 7-domain-containing protein [Lasiosphaeris hirsuta]
MARPEPGRSSLVDLIEALPDLGSSWGPPVTSETTLNGVPYAPYSKGDKLGRMADWSSDSKDGRDGRGGRQQYNRNYRVSLSDQQVYGAGTTTLFAAPIAEDESSFSVVSNVRDSAKTRFGRGAVFSRGGRGQRGGRGDSRGARQQFQRTSGRGGQQQYGGYDSRGGGGRGNAGQRGRRFGWKDYDKPARNRDASINIKPDWKLLEEIDFNRLAKLNLETDEGEDVDSYGFLYYYDRSYDKQPVKTTERKLTALDRAAYNVTTSSDPVILELADKDEATIFATDNILSMLMCSTRSVYSWDIVILRQGNKIFLDKRDNAALDMVTVNENAADAPLEASEGSKDILNQPAALAEEATYINHNFANQVMLESETNKVEMTHDNPFYNASEETAPAASKAYKYRRFDLSTSDEEPVYLVVRTELDAVQKNAISGEDQFVTVHALNEFDSKAQGSGGALDWRIKLVSQRGAVVATEMKNNSCKLARWTVQSILAKADVMKLGFVSRANPKSNDKHVVLGVVGWKPKDFANQMNLQLSNGWGIVRTIADMCLKREDGKFVLVKDPNKSILRLYEVPASSFDEEADEGQEHDEGLEENQYDASKSHSQDTAEARQEFRDQDTHLQDEAETQCEHPQLLQKGAKVPAAEIDEEEVAGVGDEEPEPRFNENGSAVKRRKLSPEANGIDVEPAASPIATTEVLPAPQALQLLNPKPRLQKPPKKAPNNPFLDDSSDDDEDGGKSSRSADAGSETATTRVRSQSPLKESEPPQLTVETLVSRKSPPLIKETLANGGNFDEFAGFEDLGMAQFDEDGPGYDSAGEEFREMEYMEEQARLEAEEGGVTRLGEGSDEAMAEGCPICNGSLAGVTEDEATAHVNACLDGNPMPLPRAPEPTKTKDLKREDSVEVLELSKRFAKAAVPRPGQTNPISLTAEDAEAGFGPGLSKSAFAKLMNGHAEDAAWATAAAVENASRGMPAYKRTCPFYKIMPGFFICVDAFRYGAVEGCNAYFLSHFHSDHYIGLTANWTHGPIYCSKVTGSLVKSQLKTAAKYVVELEFEERTPVPGTQGVSVTMIPANHCPGSSLFLFEKAVGSGKTQRILHCGDFRACPAHVAHPGLRPETVDAISGRMKQQNIDVCYLDTTYLNPRYSFPPQDEVVRACADVCVSLNKGLAVDDEAAWDALLRRREGGAPPGVGGVSKFFKPDKKSPKDDVNSGAQSNPPTPSNAFTALQHRPNRNRLLIVCGTYSIGKERICKAIALALGTKIYAAPAKIRICNQLEDAELAALMTSDPREAQVHMQMLMELRAETLAEYLDRYRAHFGRVVGFRPSGWNFRPSAANGGAGAAGGANTPPTSVPSTTLLHSTGWRTRFTAGDVVPQRGSGKEAMCFGVPYSEHSSFRELAMFLMALRIERVVPTVNVGSEQSRKKMKGWTDRWLAERRRGGLVRVLEGVEQEAGKGEKKGAGLWDGKDGKGGGVYW